MILVAATAALIGAWALGRFTPMRLPVVFLILAIVYLPLSLTQPGFNGLTLLGVLATIASIVLSIAGAPSNKEHRP